MTARRRRDLELVGLALAMMAAFGAVHLIALDVPWLRRLELFTLDLRIRLHGAQPAGPETVIVMIDDRTIAELGRWPIPRRKLADVVTRLHGAGAKVIALDILFADPEPASANGGTSAGNDGDLALARAIRDAGNVVLPFTFKFAGPPDVVTRPYLARAAYAHLRESRDYRPLALEPIGIVTPLPSFADAATLGHALIAYDVDGAPRYDYPALAYDLDFYPSMAVRVAQRFFGVPWTEVGIEVGRGISLGPVYVPTDPQMRLLANYLGPARTFPTYPLSQVLAGTVSDSTFANRIVLVGTSALGTSDTFESPFTAVMPGVERLATIIDSILHEHHLRRPPAAPWFEVAWMLLVALAMGFAMSRLSLAAASLCGLSLVFVVAASGHVALARYGLWQASAVPIVAIVLTFTALLFYRYGLLDWERRHIRRVFQRYLAPTMVDQLVKSETLPELGGQIRDLTILFCDLRGFTGLSERLDPALLTRLANEFFTAATEAILGHGGTIDKYLGDAIMAFWNAPVETPDHAVLGCRAALDILRKLDELNASRPADDGIPRLAVGIGINTGRCTVGNFGSSHRFDYSVIGDAVNVAARLESETRVYGTTILLGPETAARVPDFATLPVGRIQLRGRAEALEIHALIGDENVAHTQAFRELRAKHGQWRAAVLANEPETAKRLFDELKKSAPASVRFFYDACAHRAVNKTA
jgi:adenylate cyclase